MIPALGFLLPILGNWQRLLLYGTILLAIGTILIGYGYHKGSQRLYEYQADQAKAAVAIVVKQGKATEKIVTRYVKVKGDTQVVTTTIEKEVVRYAESNPGTCLDGAWRRLHDAAATNAVPGPASLADGESRAPPAAAALNTVTENYAACHRTADKLDALQDWVRAHRALDR